MCDSAIGRLRYRVGRDRVLRQQIGNTVDDAKGAPALGADEKVALHLERGSIGIQWASQNFK